MQRSNIWLLGAFLVGCSSNDQGTIIMPDLSVPVDLAVPSDLALLVPPDRSFLSPGGALMALTVPRQATFTVATSISSTIYYTLDGSEPREGTAATQSGPSPLSLPVGPADATLKWIADYGSQYQPESMNAIAIHIDTTTTRNNYGALTENLRFAKSGGPVVTAAPGEMVSGTLNYQAWQSSASGYCPGCILQYVVAVTTTTGAVVVTNGCQQDVQSFNVYPGKVNNQMSFSLTAPQNPGRYLLKYGLTAQFSCDGTTPVAGVAVGLVIVE